MKDQDLRRFAIICRRAAILLCIFALLLSGLSRANAQTNNSQFRRLSNEDGLSQGLVSCILQDERGYIWLGTKDGLNRYDGYDVSIYNHIPYDLRTLSHNTVSCLLEDDNGNLWVGTEKGLNLYDRNVEKFTRFVNDAADSCSLGNNTVLCMHEGRDGIIWVGTLNGLYRLDPRSRKFGRVDQKPGEPETEVSRIIVSVIEGRLGRLWIGTRGGLFWLDRDRGYLVRATSKGNVSVPSGSIIECLYEDRSGDVWIGASDRLFTYNTNTRRFAEVDSVVNGGAHATGNINAIAEDIQGRLWLGYQSGHLGILILDTERNNAIRFGHNGLAPPPLTSGIIECIYRDRSDCMWVGTTGYGAKVWSPYLHKFALYKHDVHNTNSLGSKSVRAIHEDTDGGIWVGGYGNFDRLDRSTGRWDHFDKGENNLYSFGRPAFVMCPDPASDGTSLWIGSEGSGLSRLNTQTRQFSFYPFSDDGSVGLAGRYVRALCAEPSGNVWVGTEAGLSYFDPERGTFDLIEPPGNEARIVSAIYLENEHSLWVGYVDGGVWRIDRSTGGMVCYQNQPADSLSLSHDRVLSICEGSDGRLWLGTGGGGLNEFDRDKETFKHFMEDHGLPNNVVYGILEDDYGKLWLSTNNGLCCFDPITETARNFDVRDGLQSNEFNTSSYFKSRSGEMFFGGVDGFNSFHPEELQTDPHVPAVVLTELQIANQKVPIGEWDGGRCILTRSITETKQITLLYTDDVVSFAFSALNFALPDRNRYAYTLEGLDNKWNDVGTRHFVTFTDLRPGKYTLHVKAANSDGVWNETGTAIAITVMPPFWSTLWFRLSAILTFIALLFGLHWVRVYYVRRRNRELDSINTQLRSNISERIRVENELRESEEKYRVVAHSAGEGIVTVDETGTILFVNDTMKKIFGYQEKELVGKSVSMLMPEFSVHTGGNTTGDRAGPDVQPVELWGTSKNGELLTLEISVGTFVKKKRRLYITIVRDVTGKKRLEEQFLQAQKMEAVGRLAGGIAHDLNNLLAIVLGRGELMQNRMKGDARAEKDIKEILEASGRAESLTKQLLAFSSKQMLQPKVLNVNRLIEEMARMLDRLIGETIELKLHLDPNLGNIKADPGQIEQVLMNLVVNARDATRNGGVIIIETHNLDPGKSEASVFDFVEEGSYVLILISDTGTGIDSETQKKIFEPFFTTKPQGEGTGLGLSTVYGIVKQSGGSVWAYSEVGYGTTFKVCLPRVDAEEIMREKPEEWTCSTEQTGTILVAEDEKGLRRLIADVLRNQGYEVLEAKDGHQALEQFGQNRDSIKCILTDVVMPRMGGKEFVSRISGQLGDIKVLYMSGYAKTMIVDDKDAEDDVNFIHKPFSLSELVRWIRKLVAASDTVDPLDVTDPPD